MEESSTPQLSSAELSNLEKAIEEYNDCEEGWQAFLLFVVRSANIEFAKSVDYDDILDYIGYWMHSNLMRNYFESLDDSEELAEMRKRLEVSANSDLQQEYKEYIEHIKTEDEELEELSDRNQETERKSDAVSSWGFSTSFEEAMYKFLAELQNQDDDYLDKDIRILAINPSQEILDLLPNPVEQIGTNSDIYYNSILILDKAENKYQLYSFNAFFEDFAQYQPLWNDIEGSVQEYGDSINSLFGAVKRLRKAKDRFNSRKRYEKYCQDQLKKVRIFQQPTIQSKLTPQTSPFRLCIVKCEGDKYHVFFTAGKNKNPRVSRGCEIELNIKISSCADAISWLVELKNTFSEKFGFSQNQIRDIYVSSLYPFIANIHHINRDSDYCHNCDYLVNMNSVLVQDTDIIRFNWDLRKNDRNISVLFYLKEICKFQEAFPNNNDFAKILQFHKIDPNANFLSIRDNKEPISLWVLSNADFKIIEEIYHEISDISYYDFRMNWEGNM